MRRRELGDVGRGEERDEMMGQGRAKQPTAKDKQLDKCEKAPEIRGPSAICGPALTAQGLNYPPARLRVGLWDASISIALLCL